MKLTRRSFLRGALTVAAATAMPAIALAHVPVIYGDGIHDDTVGLQALFDGKPFSVSANAMAGMVAGNGILSRGSFMVSNSIIVGRTAEYQILGCYFEPHPDANVTEFPLLDASQAKHPGIIRECCLEGPIMVGYGGCRLEVQRCFFFGHGRRYNA